MRFFLVDRITILLKITIFSLLINSNLYAFDYVIKNLFSSDEHIIELEKKLSHKNQQNKLSLLESALLNDYRDEKNIQISILHEKNNLVLKAISYYLNILENKELKALYYSYNNIFIDLYTNYPKNKLSNEKKASIKTITTRLEQASARLTTQDKKTTQSIQNYEQFTNQKFKKTNLVKQIDMLNIPKTSETAYQKYKTIDALKKEAIKNVLHSENEKEISSFIEQFYKDYYNIINQYKKDIQYFEEKNKKRESLLYIFIQNENKLFLSEDIIKLKYKTLFQKIKISFITGELLNIFQLENKHNIFKNIKLQKVHFLYEAENVTNYSMKLVEKNVKKLKKIDNYILVLNGYGDSIETKAFKDKIIKKRLQIMKNTLVKLGIDKNKIKTNVKLDKSPIGDNNTKHGRLLNRRIEFLVYKDKN